MNDLISFDQKWADLARDYAAEEPVKSGSTLTTRGGILAQGGNVIPGNQVCAVIVDAVRENTYYDEDFDEDGVVSPTCYAYGRTDQDMAPHSSMQADPSHFVPQSASCVGCPKAEWGSARRGKGKACKNRRRLALLPAGAFVPVPGSRDFDVEVYEDPKHYATASMVFLKLPVMSVRNWSDYVHQVAQEYKRPPFGVWTRIYIEPDPKSQFRVCFEALETLPDELAPHILRRHEEAKGVIAQPYSAPRDR